MFAPPVQARKPTPAPRALPAAAPLQRKLAVGRVDDPLEHEADRIADAVVRAPAPEVSATAGPTQISRKCASCEEETLRPRSARSTTVAGEAPPSVHAALGASGRPLDAATRAYFEPRFGRDLGGVRLHTDALAAQSARDVDAHAYTVGANIVFDAGRHSPGTADGRRLIAHELAHVVQQSDKGSAPFVLARQPRPAPRPPPPRTAPPPPGQYRQPSRRFRRPPTEERAPPPTNYKLNPPVQVTPGRTRKRAKLPTGPDPVPVAPQRDVGTGTDWGGAAAWKGQQRDAAHLRYMLEREPRVSLERDGEAPEFLTEGDPEIHRVDRGEDMMYDNLELGDQVDFVPRLFHVLDALEHDYALAKTADEELGVILAYLPELAIRRVPDYLGYPRQPTTYELGGKTYHPRLPAGAAIARVPVWLDRQTAPQRLEAIKAVMTARARVAQERERAQRERERAEARAATLAEAERVALQGGSRRQGKCTNKRVARRGGNDRHNIYAAHVAAEKGFRRVRTEMQWTTPEGVAYSFDVYNAADPTKVWEAKTRHEWTSPTGMVRAPDWVPDFSRRIADLEVQRLTGLYIASRCGLEFRYVVDNCQAYNGLRQQWALPPVEYIPYPNEPKVPC